MPELNGVELCKMVRKEFPEVAVIGLSMVSEMSLVRLMIKNGANGYLHKNAGKDEVLIALDRARRGKNTSARKSTICSSKERAVVKNPQPKSVPPA